MELSLTSETGKMIEDRVKSGLYASAEDVITSAMHTLEQAETFGDFAPGELDRLLAEGENSGPPVPFETYQAEMKAVKEAFRLRRK